MQVVKTNPLNGLIAVGGDNGAVTCIDPRTRTPIGTIVPASPTAAPGRPAGRASYVMVGLGSEWRNVADEVATHGAEPQG